MKEVKDTIKAVKDTIKGSEAEPDEDQRCHIGSAVSGVEDSKKNYLVGNLNFLAVLVVKER